MSVTSSHFSIIFSVAGSHFPLSEILPASISIVLPRTQRDTHCPLSNWTSAVCTLYRIIAFGGAFGQSVAARKFPSSFPLAVPSSHLHRVYLITSRSV